MTTGSYRICAVIPFYNNAGTVDDIAARTRNFVPYIILVNDGSTDGSEQRIRNRSGQIILHHCTNSGKGAAIKTGAGYALENGFTHFVTIDADGQLAPEEIPSLVRVSRTDNDAIVIGSRYFGEDVPLASRFGRWFSNLWFRIETLGYPVQDSQCGFRIYPSSLFESLMSRCNHMDFEAEILVLALRKGYGISQVPVSVRYFSSGNRVTHFRPFYDNFLFTLLHSRMCFLIFIYWPVLLHARIRSQHP